MIKLKDETQKEIIKEIIRTKNVYLEYYKDNYRIMVRCAAQTQSLLQVLWYSKGIDLETKYRLAKYISKNIYNNIYI